MDKVLHQGLSLISRRDLDERVYKLTNNPEKYNIVKIRKAWREYGVSGQALSRNRDEKCLYFGGWGDG